jgi:transposase
MMTRNKLIKKLIGVNDIKIKDVNFVVKDNGVKKIIVNVEPFKNKQQRCPFCKDGKKLPKYDSCSDCKSWRGLDCGGVLVELQSNTCRVTCPTHGVVTADVPWAFPNSRFTKDFDLSVTWLARTLNKSAISEYMRISWSTVGRCITRALDYLEPDKSNRLQGLKRIGIDETSYSKGHRYITTVVNHDTNTVVWVSDRHGKSVLENFFKMLTKEQLEGIEVVSGDGARWITECVQEYCPKARRCTDPFHVVEWANEALDTLRKDSWREANAQLKVLKKENPRSKGRPSSDDEIAKVLTEAKERVKGIKNSRYALGKAPENLTDTQHVTLAQIKSKDTKLFRAYELKESLRELLKLKDLYEAEKELNHWISWASKSRIDAFKELSKKIKRHKEYILNFISTGISNARVEANNNKISLLVHRSYGFKNFRNMVDLIMLVCSNLKVPLPNRPTNIEKTA